MVKAHERTRPIPWPEFDLISQERLDTPSHSFAKAMGAVVQSYEEGYISREEADVLLKWAAAQYIAPTIEQITSDIADMFTFDLTGSRMRSRHG